MLAWVCYSFWYMWILYTHDWRYYVRNINKQIIRMTMTMDEFALSIQNLSDQLSQFHLAYTENKKKEVLC